MSGDHCSGVPRWTGNLRTAVIVAVSADGKQCYFEVSSVSGSEDMCAASVALPDSFAVVIRMAVRGRRIPAHVACMLC